MPINWVFLLRSPSHAELVYLTLVPTQLQVWNGFHEFHGRTVMADDDWLDEPAALSAWMST